MVHDFICIAGHPNACLYSSIHVSNNPTCQVKGLSMRLTDSISKGLITDYILGVLSFIYKKPTSSFMVEGNENCFQKSVRLHYSLVLTPICCLR